MEDIDYKLRNNSESHEYESFLKDFIKSYKENRILWDKKHPRYKSRIERERALENLVIKAKEYFPEANIDFVKTRIDNIRSVFRREYKKVQDSKQKAKAEKDIYTPTLWYYNMLLFIVDEEIDEANVETKPPKYTSYSWTRHHTISLIELLKQYPIIYSPENILGNKPKRVKAYKEIATKLTAAMGRKFEACEVKSKINSLKHQFRKEYCDQQDKNIRKSTKLWCYELLMFLKESINHRRRLSQDEDNSDEEMEKLWIRFESDQDIDTKPDDLYKNENQDDIFDTIGKNVAIKLRDMTDEQRVYAENLVNEIMYNGLMEKLTAKSRIVLSDEIS